MKGKESCTYIYVICRPWSVRIGKNCVQGPQSESESSLIIAMHFFFIAGREATTSSEHSAAVGMLKLKVHPSNLPNLPLNRQFGLFGSLNFRVACRVGSSGPAKNH